MTLCITCNLDQLKCNMVRNDGWDFKGQKLTKSNEERNKSVIE